MYNPNLDYFNYLIWEGGTDELKFMLADENIDYNDTDKLGRTLLVQAVESMNFTETENSFVPDNHRMNFIKWLLEQGSDPNYPDENSPIKCALKFKAESKNGKEYNVSELVKLLEKYIKQH